MNRILPILLLIASVAGAKPNIIFFLCDDQGAETAVPYGGEWVTPNIDSLATDGMRFTQMHSCESCAPSRAMLMTGREPSLRLSPAITYPIAMQPMSTNEVTLADTLKTVGYSTCLVGKWNLSFAGGGASGQTPEIRAIQNQHIVDCGFDTNFSFVGATVQYYGQDSFFWGSTAAGYAETNYWEFLANQFAINYIAEHYDAADPFYLQYSFGLVHIPYTATPDDLSHTNASDAVLAADMAAYMDKMVSNVIAQCESLGIASNTVFLYAGDNGTETVLTNNFNGTPVAGGKLTSDDTATRVPFYVRWDGHVATNSTYTGLTTFADIYPTLCDIAGAVRPQDRIFDGRSFYNGLMGSATRHRSMFYRMKFGSWNDFEEMQGWKYRAAQGPNPKLLYRTGNWPYGDELVTEYTQSDTVAEILLSAAYEIETNRVYGVGINGSTQEFMLQRQP